MKGLRIDRVGVQAILQDRGRIGYARFGVSRSGPFDLASWSAANLGAGNTQADDTQTDSIQKGNTQAGKVQAENPYADNIRPEDTDNTQAENQSPATVEIVLGPFQATALSTVTVCIAGAPAEIRAGEPDHLLEYQHGEPIELTPGHQLSIGRASQGLRIYLAVHRGFTAKPTLGSASCDTISKLGPAPLSKGDELSVDSAGQYPRQLLSVTPSLNRSIWHQVSELTGKAHFDRNLPPRFLPDPDHQQWVVQPDSNRAGVRLRRPDSRPVAGIAHQPSTPTMTGSLQLLPNGDVVAFGPDCPTTGGYPVIGVLDRNSIDQLAQARPGSGFAIRLSNQSRF